MARQLRLEYAGGLYHLTARGNAQAAIFKDDDDRKRFLELLGRVGSVYGLQAQAIITRAHGQAYQCAAWLLHRAANLPLKEVARLFGVSPSRISHIQRFMETGRLTRLQHQAARMCNVKQ